jgi:GNAT superfamily N-acetyltransferase
MTVTVTEIAQGKSALCAAILARLPQWFGLADSNAAYIRDVAAMPVFAARLGDGRDIGFLALNRHTPYAAEIHVMGVDPAHHRAGVGRALVEAAARHAAAQGMRYLTVKTLSAAHPDPGYARTRAFYEALGFVPLEEFPTLWDAENPALMMIRSVA